MIEQYWTACSTLPNAEREARAGIEDAGFGTFLPTFIRKGMVRGRLREIERPLMPGYIFVAVSAENERRMGEIHRQLIEGVGCLLGKVSERDIQRLTLAHATGAFNVIHYQPSECRKRYAKRRRRPRPGKRLGYFANATNRVAA